MEKGHKDVQLQRKVRLFAKMIEIAVKECMRNHCYRFGGEYFLQTEGGAIGLRLTGVVAEISMAEWELKFRMMMRENLVKLWMSKI